MSMRYGFIGLGNLGAQLAGSLVRKGFSLTIHDLRRETAVPLLGLGARWAESPKACAAMSDAVITCLPSPTASASVLTANDGVLAGLQRGGTWIEMSTTDQQEILRVAKLAEQSGVETLEAPVTGGVHKAASGQITVLAAGDAALFQTHLPALRAMGGEVFHMGKLGQAAVIKVITNMLAFIHLIAAGEALMLAKKGGLDVGQAFNAIKASSGNSFVFETEGQLVLNGSYNIGFTMDLACKDLGFAHQFGRAFGVPLELGAMVEQIFRRARAQYGGDAWSTQAVKLLEDALGVDLRAPGFPSVLQE